MSVDPGRYVFTSGVSAFFEMPTSDARRILPAHLEPVEVRHERSILAVNAFHVRESVVGPYAELMLSVVVPPFPGRWGQHPKAGFYPFMAATSSEESRRHPIRSAQPKPAAFGAAAYGTFGRVSE